MFDKKAYMKKYRQTNKVQLRQYQRQYHRDNPDYWKQYNDTHKPQRQKINQRWREANPEKIKQLNTANYIRIKLTAFAKISKK